MAASDLPCPLSETCSSSPAPHPQHLVCTVSCAVHHRRHHQFCLGGIRTFYALPSRQSSFEPWVTRLTTQIPESVKLQSLELQQPFCPGQAWRGKSTTSVTTADADPPPLVSGGLSKPGVVRPSGPPPPYPLEVEADGSVRGQTRSAT